MTWLLANTFEYFSTSQKSPESKPNINLIRSRRKITKNSKEEFPKQFEEFDKNLDHFQAGKYLLTKSVLASIIVESMKYWDKSKYDLITYCIMPNHVHAVFSIFEKDEKGAPIYLQDIMKSIKNFSARKCNEQLKRKGQFWHHESYDRLIRDHQELYYTINYILDNPVKANICSSRTLWKWSYITPDLNNFFKDEPAGS